MLPTSSELHVRMITWSCRVFHLVYRTISIVTMCAVGIYLNHKNQWYCQHETQTKITKILKCTYEEGRLRAVLGGSHKEGQSSGGIGVGTLKLYCKQFCTSQCLKNKNLFTHKTMLSLCKIECVHLRVK